MRKVGDRRPALPRPAAAAECAAPGRRRGPGLARKAAGLTVAVVKHVADGGRNVSAEAYAARLAVCAECPSFNAEKNRCQECGCNMKRKARWRTTNCPLAKWPADG